MQQVITTPPIVGEVMLHVCIAQCPGDPEEPEIPNFFLTLCGQFLEECCLDQCVEDEDQATCPECRNRT